VIFGIIVVRGAVIFLRGLLLFEVLPLLVVVSIIGRLIGVLFVGIVVVLDGLSEISAIVEFGHFILQYCCRILANKNFVCPQALLQ
jgi:hypothetical protein